MQVWGLAAYEVDAVIRKVSTDKYDGNLTLGRTNTGLRDESGPRGKRARFTLGVFTSSGAGARRTYQGRRSVSANWDAHYDVMGALFDAGATRIKTSMADYRAGMARIRPMGYSIDDRFAAMHEVGPFESGRAAFDALAHDTAAINAGSVMQPAAFGDL